MQSKNVRNIQLQMIGLELDVVCKQETQPVFPGEICSKCKQGILDYDGMLVLHCRFVTSPKADASPDRYIQCPVRTHLNKG